MSRAYAYALELERGNRKASTSSVITTISTLAQYAALSPAPRAGAGDAGTGDGGIVRSPSPPRAGRRFRGIRGSFRRRREQHHEAQQRHHHQSEERARPERKPPPAKATKQKRGKKKKGGSLSLSLPLAAAADGGGQRNHSAAGKEEDGGGTSCFVQQHFPDAPRVPGPRHVPSEEECEELFASASMASCSSISSVSSLSTVCSEHAHRNNQGWGNNGSRGDTEGGYRENRANDEDKARFQLQRPSHLGWGAATGTNDVTVMDDEDGSQGSDWAASAAAAMAGVDFGEVNWGRQQTGEQTHQSWARGRSQTTAMPAPLHVREDKERLMRRKPASVDSPTTNRTNAQQYSYPQRHLRQHSSENPGGHGPWSREMSTASSKPESILIGFEDPGRMNVGLGIMASPYGSVGSNFCYTGAVRDGGETGDMADLDPRPDLSLPLLMPAVYQPEPGSLLGMGTFAPASVPARLPSQRQRRMQAQDAKKRPETLLPAALAIRRLRNESSTSSNSSSSYCSNGIHHDDGGTDYPRQQSTWEDEDVPELTPDSSRKATSAHKPSASTSSNTSTGSYAYPGWASWSSPATPPPLSLSPPTQPKQRRTLDAPQQKLQKPLPLPPALACPGCRIGGGPEEPVESDSSTPRHEHAGALRWPEELASGFCNACQLGGGLLPDYISRFTRVFDEEHQDRPPVAPEEVATLMLLGGSGKEHQEERLHGGNGDRQDGEGKGRDREEHENEQEVVRKEITVRPPILASKFHLGMTSASRIASRRRLGGKIIARCESAPPPSTSSAHISTRPASHVAECLPLSDTEAGYVPGPVQERYLPGKDSGAYGGGDREARRPQPQQANSSRPRRGGIGGGRKKRPPRLSSQVAERSLTRSNARRWTDPAESLADKSRSPLGECWELDVLKEYEAMTPAETPSLPPLEIKVSRLSWIEESPTKTPAATTPRTQTYNHFKRQNGDF